MFRNVRQLLGYRLGALDDEMGRVKDFCFDDEHWTIRYVVADTGRWLPGRQVLLSPLALGAVDDDEKILHVQLTRGQIEKSPSIESDRPISRRYEEEYFSHFGWPFYWQNENAALWGAPPPLTPMAPPPEEMEEALEGANPHLRSVNEVHGYHLQAHDGEIGHVDSFLVDETWVIRYLIVDTDQWWPGKRTLVSPLWIHQVSWEQSKVFVDLRQEEIKEAPEYVPGQSLDRAYETRLFESYEKAGYW